MRDQFTELIQEHGPLLSRVAASYEANEALRQELLQEIAVAIWQGLARFKGNSSVKTYILKIAHNRAITHVSTQVRQPSSDEFDETTSDFDVSLSPEHITVGDQAVEKLLDAVRELPVLPRQVMTLMMEGLSYDEISEICGITSSHVGVLLNRAKQKLSRSLQHV